MLLDSNDAMIIVACLKWAAMEHDKLSKAFAAGGLQASAMRSAKLSQEAARLVAEFEKAGKVPYPRLA